MAKNSKKTDVKQAGSEYACEEVGRRVPFNRKKNWQPMDGVSLTTNEEKKDGIKVRGTGAATKGIMARGPMG